MKNIAVMCMAFTLFGGIAGATTLCGSANPRDTASLNSDGGCAAGGLVFSNFQYLSASGVTSPEVDLVSASVDGTGTVMLTFNPNLSAPSGYQDLYFMFSVSGLVDQVDMTVGGVHATITETVCSAAMNINAPSCATQNTLANIVAFSAPPGPNQATSGVFSPAGTIWIFKDIGVNGNMGGGALTTFTQSFHTVFPSDVPGDVPEPVSTTLAGAGLAAIAYLNRRRRAA